jgi:hypothetical protein
MQLFANLFIVWLFVVQKTRRDPGLFSSNKNPEIPLFTKVDVFWLILRSNQDYEKDYHLPFSLFADVFHPVL